MVRMRMRKKNSNTKIKDSEIERERAREKERERERDIKKTMDNESQLVNIAENLVRVLRNCPTKNGAPQKVEKHPHIAPRKA